MNTKSTKIEELKALAMAGMQNDPGATATAQNYTVSPADITQSYYTNHSTADNYTANRPVYQQSDAVKQAADQLAQHEQNKPGEYESAYGDRIQGMIDNILNRDKFSYDFTADPTYQQYADKYQQQGKMAMKDAMGEAAALTGGYGNSYAQTVGQQTYQNHLQNLNDMIPGLRDAAYQMYQDEGDAMRGNLGMLQAQDNMEYGRYRDSVADYQSELSYFYGKYTDMSDAEYRRYQNDAAAWEADRAFWYAKEQDAQAQANWEAEFELAKSKAKSSGSSSKKSTTNTAAAVPTSYKEFCATATKSGAAGIMTELEFKRRKPTGYANYQEYLNAMWAKYN